MLKTVPLKLYADRKTNRLFQDIVIISVNMLSSLIL